MNLVCIKHPTFDGTTKPDYRCRACCTITIAKIKADQEGKTK